MTAGTVKPMRGQIVTLQPKVLRWARERARFPEAELAKKLDDVPVEWIITWEQSGEITIKLAEKLANVTHVPFGYMFLPEPPIDELPINDFRTVLTQGISNPSIELLDTINDAMRRQDWYRDYLIESGVEPLPFVGSLKASDGRMAAAERIRARVPWNTHLRKRATSWETALSEYIDAVEGTGILVMRSGVVGNNTHRSLDVGEFRGFALSDEYAPLIFINGNDVKAAQMFTLAHELVHIWLGVSGISNLNRTKASDKDIEPFCNAVAAELLVPMETFKTAWASYNGFTDQIERLAKYFRVSSLVIVRRMYDAGYLSEDEFQQRYYNKLSQFSEKPATKGGGNFYNVLNTRVGKRFLSAVVASTIEGGTPYREAFRLLGISDAETIHELASRMGAIA